MLGVDLEPLLTPGSTTDERCTNEELALPATIPVGTNREGCPKVRVGLKRRVSIRLVSLCAQYVCTDVVSVVSIWLSIYVYIWYFMSVLKSCIRDGQLSVQASSSVCWRSWLSWWSALYWHIVVAVWEVRIGNLSSCYVPCEPK